MCGAILFLFSTVVPWVSAVMCDIEDVYEESSEGEEDVEEDELRFSSDEVNMSWS